MDRIQQSQDWGKPADGPMILDSMFWLVWLEELEFFLAFPLKSERVRKESICKR